MSDTIAPRGKAARRATSPRAAAPTKRRPSASEVERIREIFNRLRADRPHPVGELTYNNPFTLLVAVVLSAQATDVSVNKATAPMFAIADTPAAMLALGRERIEGFIKTIGLFRAKAKNVVALCEQLLRDHGGEVPASRELLEALPGVGRKTANVVMNTAFGAPTIAVDTHVFRVSNRLPVARGKTPLEVELGLERRVPDEFKMHAHHWLILHGRYVCKARGPLCGRCVLADLCRAPEKRLPVSAGAQILG